MKRSSHYVSGHIRAHRAMRFAAVLSELLKLIVLMGLFAFIGVLLGWRG